MWNYRRCEICEPGGNTWNYRKCEVCGTAGSVKYVELQEV